MTTVSKKANVTRRIVVKGGKNNNAVKCNEGELMVEVRPENNEKSTVQNSQNNKTNDDFYLRTKLFMWKLKMWIWTILCLIMRMK